MWLSQNLKGERRASSLFTHKDACLVFVSHLDVIDERETIQEWIIQNNFLLSYRIVIGILVAPEWNGEIDIETTSMSFFLPLMQHSSCLLVVDNELHDEWPVLMWTNIPAVSLSYGVPSCTPLLTESLRTLHYATLDPSDTSEWQWENFLNVSEWHTCELQHLHTILYHNENEEIRKWILFSRILRDYLSNNMNVWKKWFMEAEEDVTIQWQTVIQKQYFEPFHDEWKKERKSKSIEEKLEIRKKRHILHTKWIKERIRCDQYLLWILFIRDQVLPRWLNGWCQGKVDVEKQVWRQLYDRLEIASVSEWCLRWPSLYSSLGNFQSEWKQPCEKCGEKRTAPLLWHQKENETFKCLDCINPRDITDSSFPICPWVWLGNKRLTIVYRWIQSMKKKEGPWIWNWICDLLMEWEPNSTKPFSYFLKQATQNILLSPSSISQTPFEITMKGARGARSLENWIERLFRFWENLPDNIFIAHTRSLTKEHDYCVWLLYAYLLETYEQAEEVENISKDENESTIWVQSTWNRLDSFRKDKRWHPRLLWWMKKHKTNHVRSYILDAWDIYIPRWCIVETLMDIWWPTIKENEENQLAFCNIAFCITSYLRL